MKITNSNLTLESKHTFVSTQVSSASLRSIVRLPKVDPDKLSLSLIRQASSDYLELSLEAQHKIKTATDPSVHNLKLTDLSNLDIPDADKNKLLLLARMIKAITGKDLLITIPNVITAASSTIIYNHSAVNSNVVSPDWALQFQATQSYSESESLFFNANGVINTSDGRQISLNLNLSMTHSFSYQEKLNTVLGSSRLLDPLVINYDRPSADITDTKFSFDIDSDGTKENLSTLAKGSGYLALDLNNDGTINNGSELFGTITNNGFDELKKYDSDNNNWIDENDAVFTKLKIWTVNEDGSKQLFSLADKSIGAIYLGNVDGKLGIHDSNHSLQAQATAAGIFLKENGTAGTLQQIDYVV